MDKSNGTVDTSVTDSGSESTSALLSETQTVVESHLGVKELPTKSAPSSQSPPSELQSQPHSRASDSSLEGTAAAQRTLEARTAFLASLNSVGNSLSPQLETRAADIASNSNALAKQTQKLDEATADLAKETAVYQKLADETRDKLKGIGDVQNFAEVIERELLVLEETLRLVGKETDTDEQGKGRGRWWF